ncbi:MAG: hypothetical protein ACRCZW_07120 [Lactobacillaceae bacterium]
MTKQSFNDFRFKGFDYEDQSNKYWKFGSQVNDDESKALIRIDENNVFSYYGNNGWKVYVLKLDRNHCVFIKHWQHFDGFYGTYILIDKNYYHVVDAKEPFEDMAEEGSMNTWEEVLALAKAQDRSNKENNELILVTKN